MKQPLVYIIILNWNGYRDTTKCINSLKKLNYKNYKILIIDNGSTDDSLIKLKYKFPLIKLISNKRNLGFSGGCNVGIKYGLANKSDYILLLNNDTFVNKDFLLELIRVGEKDTKIGILSPLIYYANNPKTVWFTGAFKKSKNIMSYICYENNKKDIGQYKNNQFVDCVWGCSMLIKKTVVKKIGLLDDSYFLYLEDIDYCIRASKANYKIIFVPKAKIWHKVSGSSGGEGSIRQTYYNTRNFFILSKKILSNNQRIKYYSQFILNKIIEIIGYTKKKKYNYVYTTILGLYHGIIGEKGYYRI